MVYLFSVSDYSNTESSPAAVEMERKRTCEELEGGCPSRNTMSNIQCSPFIRFILLYTILHGCQSNSGKATRNKSNEKLIF